MCPADVNSILHGSPETGSQSEQLLTVVNHLYVLIFSGDTVCGQLFGLLTGDSIRVENVLCNAVTRNATENIEMRSHARTKLVANSVIHQWESLALSDENNVPFEFRAVSWRLVILERPSNRPCTGSSFDIRHWSLQRCSTLNNQRLTSKRQLDRWSCWNWCRDRRCIETNKKLTGERTTLASLAQLRSAEVLWAIFETRSH